MILRNIEFHHFCTGLMFWAALTHCIMAAKQSSVALQRSSSWYGCPGSHLAPHVSSDGGFFCRLSKTAPPPFLFFFEGKIYSERNTKRKWTSQVPACPYFSGILPSSSCQPNSYVKKIQQVSILVRRGNLETAELRFSCEKGTCHSCIFWKLPWISQEINRLMFPLWVRTPSVWMARWSRTPHPSPSWSFYKLAQDHIEVGHGPAVPVGF